MKPTIAQLKHGDQFRLILKLDQGAPMHFVRSEMRRRTWPILLLAFVALVAIGTLTHSLFTHPGTVWQKGGMVFGGILLGSLITPLLCFVVQSLTLKSMGVRRSKVVFGEEEGVANLTAPDHVFSRREYLRLLHLDLLVLAVWVALTFLVPSSRPLLAAILILECITHSATFALRSLFVRYRKSEVYVFDDSTDGKTHFYERVPDAVERVTAPARLASVGSG